MTSRGTVADFPGGVRCFGVSTKPRFGLVWFGGGCSAGQADWLNWTTAPLSGTGQSLQCSSQWAAAL